MKKCEVSKIDRKRVDAKPPNKLTFSVKGMNFLKSIEKLATKPYDDQTGKDIIDWVKGATIGYGHLISEFEWSRFKDGITACQAESLLSSDLFSFINGVKSKLAVDITQNEFDAMVILAFNIGMGKKGFSGSSVLKLVHDPCAKTRYGDLEKAWKAWNKSQGVPNKGLINRRKAEWNIYKNGTYENW